MLICTRLVGIVILALSLAALFGKNLPPGLGRLLLNHSAMYPEGAAGSLILGLLIVLTFRTHPFWVRTRYVLYALLVPWSVLVLLESWFGYSTGIRDWFVTPWRVKHSGLGDTLSLSQTGFMILFAVGHGLLHSRRADWRKAALVAIVLAFGVGATLSVMVVSVSHFAQAIFSQNGATMQGLTVGVLLFCAIYLGWAVRRLGYDRGRQGLVSIFAVIYPTALAPVVSVLLVIVAGSLLLALEGERRDHVEAHLRGQAELVDLALRGALDTAEVVMDSPGLATALERINRDGGARRDLAAVDDFAKSAISDIITGVRVVSLRQQVLAETGRMPGPEHVSYVLGHDVRMYWDGGVHINVVRRVIRNGFPVGIVEFEMPLAELDLRSKTWGRAGKESESLLCTPTDTLWVECLRMGQRLEIHHISRKQIGAARAITAAIDGSHGSILVVNRNSGLSLAAFGGLRDYPLGMVVEVDVQEVVGPAREALRLMLLACLLASLLMVAIMFPNQSRSDLIVPKGSV